MDTDENFDFAPIRVVRIDAELLRVPLRVPFTIATAELHHSDGALVRIELEHRGPRAIGIGEAGCLYPVTQESGESVVNRVRALNRASLAGGEGSLADLFAQLTAAPAARAALESAGLDAASRLEGLSAAASLRRSGIGGSSSTSNPLPLTCSTDITLSIADEASVMSQASGFYRDGFRVFKMKVGHDVSREATIMKALIERFEGAKLILDANGGYSSDEAMRVLDAIAALPVLCFEQPCAREDTGGMRRVTAQSPFPVVADESLRSMDDFVRIRDEGLAHGVNLKLVKLGGPVLSFAIGTAAKAAGMCIMAGAMVDTKLGLTAMGHVVAALGGVDFVDLDTAFLLTGDPWQGGYTFDKDQLTFPDCVGFGVSPLVGGD